MTRIILSGAKGHMGKVIADLVENRDDMVIVAGVDPIVDGASEFPVYSTIDDVKEEADVVIDFSHPSALSSLLSHSLLKYSLKKVSLPLILCTTGYSSEQVESIKRAGEFVPIFYSRNMSLGINLLIELAKKATAVLGDMFDVEIIEKHHNLKVDAPSGTALMIADAISSVRDDDPHYMYDRHSQRKKRDKNEIGLHAVRGGTIVGEHEVIFAGRHENITISHSAQSKELFAVGAVNAAKFMVGKPAGLYDMSAMI